jgi:hypothetical protein
MNRLAIDVLPISGFGATGFIDPSIIGTSPRSDYAKSAVSAGIPGIAGIA